MGAVLPTLARSASKGSTTHQGGRQMLKVQASSPVELGFPGFPLASQQPAARVSFHGQFPSETKENSSFKKENSSSMPLSVH